MYLNINYIIGLIVVVILIIILLRFL